MQLPSVTDSRIPAPAPSPFEQAHQHSITAMEKGFAVVFSTDRLLSELATYIADPTPTALAVLSTYATRTYELVEIACQDTAVTPLSRARFGRFTLTDEGEQVCAVLDQLDQADEQDTDDPYALDACPAAGAPDHDNLCVWCHHR